MAESIINHLRILQAQTLISENHQIMHTRFESLGNELYLRSNLGNNTTSAKLGRASNGFRYVSDRLSDLLARLNILNWIRGEIAKVPEKDRLDAMTGASDTPWMWNVFAGLAIKDFHTDIGSLMDSIALMLIRLESTVSLDGWVPPFSAIQNEQGKKKTYRKTIPESILLVVDETDRWWPTVKNVRDLGIHKEHLRIVYPGLSEDDGLLFNVYRGGFTPVISEPLVMYPNGNNVVDFSLYSGFILAEVLMFLEDLAAPIADSFGVQNLTPSLRQDDFSRLASAWNRLAQPKS